MKTLHKVLVTGATGFVGQLLCRNLLDSGIEVLAAARQRRPEIEFAGHPFTQIEVGEIRGDTDWSAALAGVETVFHLAARVHVMRETADDAMAEFRRVNVLGTLHLARCAAACGAKRLVYVSSIGVNGTQTTGLQHFSELDPPSPQGDYAVSKREAEQALHQVMQDTGLEIVIVRPPLVYGKGAPGNFEQMVKVLKLGLPLPFASVANLRDFIYVENLVDALRVCATHPAAVGQTYLVSDGEDISTPNLLRQLGAAMGHPVHLFPCPPALLKLAGCLTGRSDQIERLSSSLRVDSGKIRRELNWTPPYTLEQGLRATADWYRRSQPLRGLK